MKTLVTAMVIVGCALAGAAAVLTNRAGGASPQPVWNEGAWPFPMDQWGKGKAFTCKAADCGVAVTVFVRAKIGFCNCATGVADDEELDRISDYGLFDNRLVAQGEGSPIAVAWMKGRARAFGFTGPLLGAKSALSVGFNDRCDAIIATAVVDSGSPKRVESAVLGFLNSATVLRWAEVTLGL